MPTLSERFDTSLGGVDVSVSIGGEAQKIVAIAELVARLIDNPPDEFGDYLKLLSEIELPDLGFATELTGTFGALQDLIPADISDVNAGLLGNLDALESTALTGVTDVIQPAIGVITALMTLFRGDISCGLIGGFAGAAPAGGSGTTEPAEPPPPPPPPAPGEPNPGPQNPVVSRDQVDAAKAMVDLMPTPLTVGNLLPWLAEFWGDHDIPYNVLRAVPFLDDIRGPVATMAAWQALDGPGVIGHFATTLSDTATAVARNSTDFVDQVAAELQTMLAPLDGTVLATAFDDLVAGFDAIGAALEDGDISGIDADIARINSSIASLQTQHSAWSASVNVPLGRFIDGYGDFPDILEDHIVELVSLLQPRPALRDVFGGRPPAALEDSGADLGPMDDLFEAVQNFLNRVLDAIDLAAVFEPIAEPFEQASGVVEQIDQQLVSVTLEVQSRLASLEEAIDGIELDSLQTEAQQAIDDFSGRLQTELASAFEPVRSAFATIMTELAAAVDGFDPASLEGDIRNVIDTITGVFDSPEVRSALEQLQQLTDIGDSLDSLSFSPLTDVVIDGIDEVRNALDSIDEDSLDPPLPQMLGAAMMVLPRDVRPLTDPLIGELGDLIEAGPVGLIEQVRQYPAQLFDRVRRYDPEHLVGDALAAPYRSVLDSARAFSPANVLGQVEQEFDKLKDRIKDTASPGHALQPLVSLHQDLQVGLAQLDPGNLIEPVDQKIQNVMQAVGEAIDLDALLQPLSQVVEEVNRRTDEVRKGLDLVKHVLGKLDDLADAPAQIGAWVDGIFEKIPDGTDISALSGPLGKLAGAVENTRSAQLQAHITAQFAPLETLLNELDAGRRLTAAASAASSVVRSEVQALEPDTPQKTALLTLLDSFSMTDAEISGVMRQLSSLATVHAGVGAGLTVKFSGWDSRFHRPGGTLEGYNQPGADLARIRTWLREAVDRQIAWPLEAVFGKIAVLKNILDRLVELLDGLVTEIDAKIATLLAAPQAVLDLGGDVQNLVDRIAGINLDFLQDSINEVFDAVRGKFNDVSPTPIQRALDEAFAEAIDAIRFDLVIPTDSFDEVSAAFDGVLLKLESLDPDEILVEPLQAAFEETIQPFIDGLDVTPLLDAVIARLRALEGELGDEMERVNTAYQAMLAAAPDTGLSINVDIGF